MLESWLRTACSSLNFKGDIGNCTSIGDMGIDEDNNIWITTDSDQKILINSGDNFTWSSTDASITNLDYSTLTSGVYTISTGTGNQVISTILGPSYEEVKPYQPPAPEGEMRVYDVEVVETHKKKTKILAENFDNACNIARDMYNEGNINFDNVDVDIG